MSRIARTAEECDALFAEYVNAANLDGLVSLYEPGARYVRRDGTIVIGHDELRKALAALTTTPTNIRMHIVRVIAGGDVAVIYNDWTLTQTHAGGGVTQSSGKAIEIVRRQPDGLWLFAIDDPFARTRDA